MFTGCFRYHQMAKDQLLQVLYWHKETIMASARLLRHKLSWLRQLYSHWILMLPSCTAVSRMCLTETRSLASFGHSPHRLPLATSYLIKPKRQQSYTFKNRTVMCAIHLFLTVPTGRKHICKNHQMRESVSFLRTWYLISDPNSQRSRTMALGNFKHLICQSSSRAINTVQSLC